MRPAPAGRKVSALWWGLPLAVVTFVALRVQDTDSVAFVASQAVFLLVVWLSAVSTLLAARAAKEAAARRTWVLLALACTAIAVGETAFSAYQVLADARGPAGVTGADLFYGIGAVGFFAAMLSLYSSARMSRLVRARRIVDAFGLVAVAFAGVNTVVYALAGRTSAVAVDTAVEATYVLVGLVILGGAILNALAIRGRDWLPWEGSLILGLSLYGIAVTLWPVWHLYLREDGAQGTEVALSVLFLCGHFLFFMAGVYRVAGPVYDSVAEAGMRPRMPLRPAAESVLVASVLLVAIPVLGFMAVRAPEGSELGRVDFAVMAFVGLAMVLRTAIDAVETGRLRRRAGTDSLTGLPDVRAIHAQLTESVRLNQRYGQPASVVVVDLNDFGRINTLYGREEADALLKEAAKMLLSKAGEDATVGRLGSDDFVVVLDGVGRAEALMRAAELRAALREVTTSAGLPLTASWGIATCPDDSARPRDLVTKGYAAQQWAKSHGKDSIVAYDSQSVDVLDVHARASTAEEEAELDMLLAIAVASEARHETTRYHSRNVAALAVRVAEVIGMSPRQIRDAEVAALLHDIGKAAVPDEVLMKRAPRTRAEEALFREHAVTGARIVEASSLRRVASAIRAHHERWDGSGYPDGLSGEAIPEIARIVAACDAFECMVAGRPDRPALSYAAAFQELDQNLGIAYDPEVAEALIAVLANAPDDPLNKAGEFR
jgi:diguanylate cyclase (GGDEF)-like protein/putative nucleotidyltransferase with HDIG domain